MKTCARCKKDFPDEDFIGVKGEPTKNCVLCREKAAEYHRRYNAANREKVRERSRRWQEANREKDLAQRREAQKRYRAKNRERIIAKAKKKYHDFIEVVREKDRARYAADPSKKIASAQRHYNANREKILERKRQERIEQAKHKANAEMEALFPGMLLNQITQTQQGEV